MVWLHAVTSELIVRGYASGVVMAFSIFVLGYDTVWGPGGRPQWITSARSYPFVNMGSEALVKMISERRKDAVESEAKRLGKEAVKTKLSGK